MRYELFGRPDHSWIFEELERRSQEEKQEFFQLALQRISAATSPEEVAQKALRANSPAEAARRLLKTPEQLKEFIKLLQQEGNDLSAD